MANWNKMTCEDMSFFSAVCADKRILIFTKVRVMVTMEGYEIITYYETLARVGLVKIENEAVVVEIN